MNSPYVAPDRKVSEIEVIRLHQSLGGRWINDTTAHFCVWNPEADRTLLHLDGLQEPLRMTRDSEGYHRVTVPDLRGGECYQFQFDQSAKLPDPASRFQPRGVHGPSQLIDPSFDWTDGDWQGIQRRDWVIYELHLGTFTDEGTYLAAIDRLDELVDLGITAIELMPIADAAGRWNWGYDGVNWFAPNRNYGTPRELREFVDAAHSKGLAVFLDVVFNHLGPEGNHLGASGPYLSQRHHTAWGSAPNVDDPTHGDAVRRFIIANAVYWLDEFHFDGLRVDAIHCMKDDREPHIAVEMAEAFSRWSQVTKRPAILIAESNVYDPEMTRPIDEGGCGFDAQWGDCFLHSVFASLRPGEQLSQRNYESQSDLEQVLKMGYVYRGTLRDSWVRAPLGERVETGSLIYSIQNHDFIGNHPLGKRLHQVTSREAQKAAAALLILSPAVPMLFMGEEFACDRAFQFFVDFSDEELRRSVIEGRQREYPQHDWQSGILPTDPIAFKSSKIGAMENGDLEMRDWYRILIQLRRDWLSTGLLNDANLSVRSDSFSGVSCLTYQSERKHAEVIVRLSKHPTALSHPLRKTEVRIPLVANSIPGSDLDSIEPNHALIRYGDRG